MSGVDTTVLVRQLMELSLELIDRQEHVEVLLDGLAAFANRYKGQFDEETRDQLEVLLQQVRNLR